MPRFSKTTVRLTVEQLQVYCQQAWDFCWKDKQNPESSWRDEPWLTASDIEERIRTHFDEVTQGKPYGSLGARKGWHDVRVAIVTARWASRTDLMGVCRDWLLRKVREGVLESHNFGRGHISGMRFRPFGSRKSESEEKALSESREERSRKRHIVHFAFEMEPKKNGQRRDGRLCEENRKPRPFGGMYRSRKWFKDTTEDETKVTCKRCLALLKKIQAEASEPTNSGFED